jgi:hypothetical protein
VWPGSLDAMFLGSRIKRTPPNEKPELEFELRFSIVDPDPDR